MTAYHYAIVAAGTLLWFAPFPLVRSKQRGPVTVDRRARWGVALQFLGYTLLWQGAFWTRSPVAWQAILSICFFCAACFLSWTAARVLGRQHRIDAALNANHELVRSGPYRVVRHPIYTSMLCVLIGTGILIASPYLFLAAVLLFLAGTEIRMRIEDSLLEARFAGQFKEYRRSVRGLIPFVR